MLMEPEFPDVIFLHDGRLMTVHAIGTCSGPYCCVHNPSDHPLRNLPLYWVPFGAVMERVCAHGIRHPDPDDVAHWRRLYGDRAADARAAHCCDTDRCCENPTATHASTTGNDL
jgi:hypothetical protein